MDGQRKIQRGLWRKESRWKVMTAPYRILARTTGGHVDALKDKRLVGLLCTGRAGREPAPLSRGVVNGVPTDQQQNTRTPEHQNTRTPEHQNTRTPEQQNNRTPTDQQKNSLSFHRNLPGSTETAPFTHQPAISGDAIPSWTRLSMVRELEESPCTRQQAGPWNMTRTHRHRSDHSKT